MSRRLRVGWVAASTLAAERPSFGTLPPPVAMRIGNVALQLNRDSGPLRNELYRAGRRYDVVVFVKAMDRRCQAEAERIKAYGGRVVFDANVNYYEIWGDYELPGTRPTAEQQRDAEALTRMADLVVADSTYLQSVIRKLNPRVEWIPDNVDTRLFRPRRRPRQRSERVRLAWSGMHQKALPLRDLVPVLGEFEGIELVVCSDKPPAELEELQRALPTEFVSFSLRRYAHLLRDCDVIVSPKRLVNGYELGHSEWKIALGMAAGLPAVASPQQSYVEAIGADGGGIVASSQADWRAALAELIDPVRRAELGLRARKTVVERYSTPVVAERYGHVLEALV